MIAENRTDMSDCRPGTDSWLRPTRATSPGILLEPRLADGLVLLPLLHDASEGVVHVEKEVGGEAEAGAGRGRGPEGFRRALRFGGQGHVHLQGREGGADPEFVVDNVAFAAAAGRSFPLEESLLLQEGDGLRDRRGADA